VISGDELLRGILMGFRDRHAEILVGTQVKLAEALEWRPAARAGELLAVDPEGVAEVSLPAQGGGDGGASRLGAGVMARRVMRSVFVGS
jgi:hypothetical protein